MSIPRLTAKLNAIDNHDDILLYLAFCIVATGMTNSDCNTENGESKIVLHDIQKAVNISNHDIDKHFVTSWLNGLASCNINNPILLESMIQVVLNISNTSAIDLYLETCKKQLRNKKMRLEMEEGIKLFSLSPSDKVKVIDYMIMLITCGNNILQRMISLLMSQSSHK